jgi:hypothetical protein
VGWRWIGGGPAQQGGWPNQGLVGVARRLAGLKHGLWGCGWEPERTAPQGSGKTAPTRRCAGAVWVAALAAQRSCCWSDPQAGPDSPGVPLTWREPHQRAPRAAQAAPRGNRANRAGGGPSVRGPVQKPLLRRRQLLDAGPLPQPRHKKGWVDAVCTWSRYPPRDAAQASARHCCHYKTALAPAWTADRVSGRPTALVGGLMHLWAIRHPPTLNSRPSQSLTSPRWTSRHPRRPLPPRRPPGVPPLCRLLLSCPSAFGAWPGGTGPSGGAGWRFRMRAARLS